MNRATRIGLLALVGFLGAVILLALTVYPFQYGLAESSLLAGAFVLLAAFEFVLEDSSI